MCESDESFEDYQPIRLATQIMAAAAAAAATSASKIPKLHKIPAQNLKKLQKFANLINPYMSDKPIPTTTTPTTIPD